MIVTPAETIDRHRTNGLWGRVTLDALFRKTAQAHPGRIAIVDAPDRSEWTGGEPRSLTYAEAEQEIERLAGFYAAVGLATDHVVGLHAPNTVDAVIAFLAALRAGLIVTPLPLHWRQKDVLEALNRIGAKGLVAADRLETRQMGHAARDVAAELFSLRFVFGLGKEIPDGLIELGPMLAEMGDGLMAPDLKRPDAAEHTATITWSRGGRTPMPVTRSHNQWIAAGFMPFLETRLDEGAHILVPYALSGLTGIGAGLLPWLLSSGTLHLHHPTALSRLAAHADAVEADYVLLPGPLAQTLDARLACRKTTVVAAWSISAPQAATFVPSHTLVDLHVADEYALVARLRGKSARIHPTALGAASAPSGSENAPALVELKAEDGEDGRPPVLSVRGPMVPETGWTAGGRNDGGLALDASGFLRTGISVTRVDGGIAGFGIPGENAPGAGDLEALDLLYQAYPEVREAAAFLVEDPVLGARLYAALVPNPGATPDARAFFAYLDAERVDLAKIPLRVLMLQVLPRHEDGTIDRARLALRVQRLAAAVA
ncbi:AMP-binding protein [Polymorphum gilvum]|uniref:Possible acid-CoA ligase n=1 Tax=Polymorphum gilvum (strain LMG 25793 / CGMCC 1.9160 / SL003B-26A1) TaxID=991905 RepID=F2IZT4_POLGS|nr:class I adenylate-forming enzyme family protein [Polymorphum gilvum]ADZ70660.1 Possible acid-CoA ligase [Polymorphum gilvum SL003B-26A1]